MIRGLVMKNISEIITDRHKRLNMSQTELAEKLGVSISYLSKLEH